MNLGQKNNGRNGVKSGRIHPDALIAPAFQWSNRQAIKPNDVIPFTSPK